MLPWADLIRSAVALGLSPDAFWACSLREWRWLAGKSDRGFAQSSLEDLIRQFPDTCKETRHGDL